MIYIAHRIKAISPYYIINNESTRKRKPAHDGFLYIGRKWHMRIIFLEILIQLSLRSDTKEES